MWESRSAGHPLLADRRPTGGPAGCETKEGTESRSEEAAGEATDAGSIDKSQKSNCRNNDKSGKLSSAFFMLPIAEILANPRNPIAESNLV